MGTTGDPDFDELMREKVARQLCQPTNHQSLETIDALLELLS